MRQPLIALLDHLAEWGALYDLEQLSMGADPEPGE
jgi:hypothetical protein